jgi:hypothetical protein
MALKDYVYDPSTGFIFRNGKKVGSYTRKYGRFLVDKKQITISRFAVYYMTGKWPENEVDHINGDTHDDRWCNLRECTRLENAKNKSAHKTNKLGMRGVYTSSHKGVIYYHASIQTNGKREFLGSFKSAEEAHEAYKIKAKEQHKEFTRSN